MLFSTTTASNSVQSQIQNMCLFSMFKVRLGNYLVSVRKYMSRENKKSCGFSVLMKVQERGMIHSILVTGELLLRQLAQLVSLRYLRCNGKRRFKCHFC